MAIIISNTSGSPIYEQIKAQIKEDILRGELEEGEALPSLRQLARDLKISVLTVSRAYGELEAEGYITNMQGRGAYVLAKDNELIREQILRDVEEYLAKALAAGRRAGLGKEDLVNILHILGEVDNYE